MAQQENIYKVIKDLPAFNPSGQVWKKIEQTLDKDQQISELIQHLPINEPGISAWDNITGSLTDENKVKRFKRIFDTKHLAIAASIALLVGLGFYFEQTRVGEQIAYSVEIGEWPVVKSQEFESSEDKELRNFIAQSCSTIPNPCDSEVFKALLSELDEFEDSLAELDMMSEMYGQDENLAQTRVELENSRIEVMNELIQLLI
ncbi:MAG: hypothetical protein COC01_08305 [Bacteroidetes bacterium]|nr:hypothetical protein [Bacteroidia bacterium]PCH66338.1 MAG: hypothetical protein COC01_08305 [Bacteroidota bacterium]